MINFIECKAHGRHDLSLQQFDESGILEVFSFSLHCNINKNQSFDLATTRTNLC